MRKKGFTLVELLAVLVLLSIITLIAVPNVLGIIENNKKATYIADAKRFAALAESFVHTNTSVTKPTTSNNVVLKITLGALDTTDFTTSPDGYDYNTSLSFVSVKNENKRLKYFVHLVSVDPNDSNVIRGIELTKLEDLNKEDRFDKVKDLTKGTVTTNEMLQKMFGNTTTRQIKTY